MHLAYGHGLIHIDVSSNFRPAPDATNASVTQIIRKVNEDMRYFISVKFSSICNLGLGYDEFGKPCARFFESPHLMIGRRLLSIVILFKLHTPPSFRVQCNGNHAPDGTEHQWAHNTYDRLSALDNAHACITPFARHLRVLLANRDDLVKFEQLCHIT